MLFQSVDLSNGELLLNLVELKNNDEVLKNRSYGRNTKKVLDNIELSFRLSDVSPIEAIAFRDLSTDFLVLSKKYVDLKDQPEYSMSSGDEYVDLQHRLIKLFDHLFSDDYKLSKHPEKIGYPLMSIRYELRVTFKGYGLMQLYGYDFNKFFEIPKDSKVDPNQAIETNIVNLTMARLYEYIRGVFNYNDPLSDALIHERYKNIPDGEIAILESIIGPDGLYFPFVNSGDIDTSVCVDKLKQAGKISPSGIRYRFLCRTTFETFVLLYVEFFKKGVVTDYQNILQLIGDPNFYVPDKFMEAHSITINKLMASLNEEAKSIEDPIYRLYYILNNTKISYTIELDSGTMLELYETTKRIEHKSHSEDFYILKDKMKQIHGVIHNIITS